MTTPAPLKVEMNDLTLSENIFDLFNGRGKLYIPNPWFDLMKTVGNNFDNLFTANTNSIGRLIITPPTIYYVDKSSKIETKFISNFYINLFPELHRVTFFKPTGGKFSTFINKMLHGLGTFEHQPYERNLLDIEHKLRLALEYLMVAKLFNIINVRTEEDLFEVCKKCVPRAHVKMTLEEFRKSRKSLIEVLKLTSLKEPIRAKNNSIAECLSVSDINANHEMVIKYYPNTYNQDGMISVSLAYIFAKKEHGEVKGCSKFITKENEQLKVRNFTYDDYKNLIGKTRKAKFIIKLIYNINKSDGVYFNYNLLFKVGQCYVEQNEKTEDQLYDVILIDDI